MCVHSKECGVKSVWSASVWHGADILMMSQTDGASGLNMFAVNHWRVTHDTVLIGTIHSAQNRGRNVTHLTHCTSAYTQRAICRCFHPSSAHGAPRQFDVLNINMNYYRHSRDYPSESTFWKIENTSTLRPNVAYTYALHVVHVNKKKRGTWDMRKEPESGCTENFLSIRHNKGVCFRVGEKRWGKKKEKKTATGT